MQVVTVDKATESNEEAVNTDEAMAVPSNSPDSSQTVRWVRFAWALHFVVTLLVMASAINHNQDTRKYTPISPHGIDSECRRAFVNVLAESSDEQDAIMCCNEEQADVHHICAPKYLLLSGRLTRFPEAWLLPLFPFLLRWTVGYFQAMSVNWGMDLRRLGLYFATMIVRGFIFYVGLNLLEEVLISPAGGDCWYMHLLKPHQSHCYGREFDFSDHIVLFFVQILPIALMEVLHSLVFPFWKVDPSSDSHRPWLSRVMPFALVLCLMYLYVIVLMNVHKTAAYFHTGPEILAGYAASLLVQLPFAFLQCFPNWHGASQYFFGISPSRGHND